MRQTPSRRALSDREIARIVDHAGSASNDARWVESVIEINPGGRSRSYELRVKDVTGTFCADYFRVIVTETTPGSCLIEWSVRLPNGHERRFARTRRDGALEDPEILRFAFRSALADAIVWAVTFQGIVPAMKMADAIGEIAMTLSGVKGQLEAVQENARELPDHARVALDEALRGVESRIPRQMAELNELMARLLRPVVPPRR